MTYNTKAYCEKSSTHNFSVETQEISQLYVKKRVVGSDSDSSTVFDLRVNSINDKDQVMIEGHKRMADLFFIEQYIEEFLGIEDVTQSSEMPNVSTVIPSVSDVIKLIKNR